MAEEGKLEVKIIERREVSFPAEEEGVRVEVWITYRYGTLPPGLVRIPKEEHTPEEEKVRIKADIQRRLEAKPEVVKV